MYTGLYKSVYIYVFQYMHNKYILDCFLKTLVLVAGKNASADFDDCSRDLLGSSESSLILSARPSGTFFMNMLGHAGYLKPDDLTPETLHKR